MERLVQVSLRAWEWAQRLGPYLIVEIVLPGGTLIALLLFWYQRRSVKGGAVRAAMTPARALARIASGDSR
jgi:hypothetical protein